MADEVDGTERAQGGDAQAQGGLRGALPIVVSVAAAAAAGGIAVVARKALSGGGAGGSGDGDREEGATSFEDLDQVAGDLSRLVEELRSAAGAEGERDYKRLVEIADAISEYADQAAGAFDAAASGSGDREDTGGRVTDDLMSRVQSLTAEKREPDEVREQAGVGSSQGE